MDLDLRVDVQSTLHFTGSVCKYISVPLAVPVVVALLYGESPVPFLAGIAVTLGLGSLLEFVTDEDELGHREGFLMVALTWLLVPVVGTVPYLVAGQGTLAQPDNALFESMSGFTTTGATIMGQIDVGVHGHAMMLWRQLTQWLGGMGIVVLMVAILPELSVGGAQLVREEAPGIEIDKLTPRIRGTAAALWKIYAAFTLLAAAVYYVLHLTGQAPNMDLYNAVAHALTTMPTGGFSPEARSAEAFSPAIQWAIMVFMVVAGTNFALFWYAVTGEHARLVKNAEFRWYLFATLLVGGFLAAVLYLGQGLASVPTEVATIPGYVERSLRQGLFQSIAIVTTTGYASMDFNTWSDLAKLTLLFAMFLGGSAGSAAGGIKIIRWYVVSKSMGRELFTTIHPEAIRPIRIGKRAATDETVRSIFVFVLVFLTIFVLSTVLLYLDAVRVGVAMTALEAASMTIATLGNVGPGFGVVGPMNSYEPFSAFSKLYMVFLMWIGRLEILSVLVILTPAYWRS